MLPRVVTSLPSDMTHVWIMTCLLTHVGQLTLSPVTKTHAQYALVRENFNWKHTRAFFSWCPCVIPRTIPCLLSEKNTMFKCGAFGDFGLMNLVLETVLFSCNPKRMISVVWKSTKMITLKNFQTLTFQKWYALWTRQHFIEKKWKITNSMHMWVRTQDEQRLFSTNHKWN